MAVLRMTHVGICVTDLERSIRFYRDLLGFAYRSELRVQGEPSDTLLRLRGVDLQAVYLERDGTRIELLHYAAPDATGDGNARAMNARGLTHLSLRVDSVHETLATLRGAGARVLDETLIDIPDFGAAAIFVADPEAH
jgi:catechol 2,3-dioxygenase-like lactoylglutathione lyase family enzyme